MSTVSMAPVVVSRIQNRRGTQSQFNALYPPGYNGIGGFGSIAGSLSATTATSGTGTVVTLQLAAAGGTYTNSNTIATLGTVVPGGSYLYNVYDNVPLTGGTGAGARATITVNGATNVSIVTLTNGGAGYTVGDILSAAPADIGIAGTGFTVVVATLLPNGTFSSGALASLGTVIPGLNYLPGSYTGVPLTGGHGSGAQATIVVNGATNVSSVVLTNLGTGYAPGDMLSASAASLGIPVNPTGAGLHAAGFSVVVSTITPTPPGPPATTYAVGSTINVTGITPSAYNGTFIVTASTPTSVSYLSTATGLQVTGGLVSSPYNLTNFPNVLMPGELALCTDSRRTFIGNINGEYIELAENISGSGLNLAPLEVSLPPAASFTVIPVLTYLATPFTDFFYSITDSASPDWNTAGVNFSRNGILTITATSTSATLTDTGTEINTLTPDNISFIATLTGPNIQISYMHNFPGTLNFVTSSVKWGAF